MDYTQTMASSCLMRSVQSTTVIIHNSMRGVIMPSNLYGLHRCQAVVIRLRTPGLDPCITAMHLHPPLLVWGFHGEGVFGRGSYIVA